MGEREIYREERDALEEETRKIVERGMEKFGTQGSTEKMIAILGDRWWPQTARPEGAKISKKFLCNIWAKT